MKPRLEKPPWITVYDDPQEAINTSWMWGDWRPTGIFILVYDGHVGFIEPDSSEYPLHYIPPQGGVEKGETLLDAFYEEIWEEAGVSSDQVDLAPSPFYQGSFILDYARITRRHRFTKGKEFHLVVAYARGFVGQAVPGESRSFVWFPDESSVWDHMRYSRPRKREAVIWAIKNAGVWQ